MNKILLITVCVALFIGSFLSVISWRIWQVKQVQEQSFSPQPTAYELKPPATALAATTAQIQGDVQRQARGQTEFAALENNVTVLENEGIKTGPDGTGLLAYPDQAVVSFGSNTKLSLLSTDPAHFLLQIDQGLIDVATSQAVPTISVRSLHTLITFEQGGGEIKTDPANKLITITMRAGNGTLGFIDSDNNTQMIELQPRQTLIFDDAKRVVNN